MARPYIRQPYRQGTHSWLQEQYFAITGFAGGLNNVKPDNEINDNESTDCKNMRFMDDTIMEKRSGTAIYDSVNYPDLDEPITWLDSYRCVNKEPSIIRGTSTKVYSGNTVIQEVQGSIRGVTYINKYYFVDGKNLYCYDGEHCYRIIREPIVHLSEEHALNSTVLKVDRIPEQTKVGDKVTILSATLGTETNLVTEITAIDSDNKTVTIKTAITGKLIESTPIFLYEPIPKPNVEGKKIFDYEHNIAYYLPCFNELDDSFAGESYFPDSPNLITVHKSRLFISGDTEQPHGVYMSRTSNPLYFPSGAGLGVRPDGNKIIDLVVFDNALLIIRHNDMYALYGNSEYQLLGGSVNQDAFYIKQLDVSCGVMCAGSGALLNNYYIYLGYDGRFYKLNTPTTYVEYLMTAPLHHKCDIYSHPFTFPQNSTVDVNAVAYRNEIYFHINDNCIIVYNYDNMSFTYFEGMQDSSLDVYENQLLIGRNDGKLAVYKDEDNIYNDLGTIIECKYDTKRFDLGNPISFKYFKQFMLSSHTFEDLSSSIAVKIEVDFTDIDLAEVIPSNQSRYDFAKWNLDIFNNARSLYKSMYYLLDIRGRTIKFKFSNSILNEPMRIYDVNTLYTIRDVR